MTQNELVFGTKFCGWSTAKQLNYLKKLSASQNEALDLMQKERDALGIKVIEMKALLMQAQEALNIQKIINMNALTKQNEDNQNAGERIQELQAKLRSH